jgi:acetyltransferase-like isoleucine patch superfamily enzyme
VLTLFFRAFGYVFQRYEAFRVDQIKKQFKYCGTGLFLETTAVIWPPSGLQIGDDCAINGYTFIFAGGGVSIGSGTLISAGCVISSVTHPKNKKNRGKEPPLMSPVHIGENVWLGGGAIVLPGVTIRKHQRTGFRWRTAYMRIAGFDEAHSHHPEILGGHLWCCVPLNFC